MADGIASAIHLPFICHRAIPILVLSKNLTNWLLKKQNDKNQTLESQVVGFLLHPERIPNSSRTHSEPFY